MSSLDPIADYLTRIRNANRIKSKNVIIPYSKLKENISKVLEAEGYIVSYSVANKGSNKKNLIIVLKYNNNEPVIHGIKKISKQGRREYAKVKDIPYVLGGFGIAILTTSKGILTDHQARKEKIGGEVICFVW